MKSFLPIALILSLLLSCNTKGKQGGEPVAEVIDTAKVTEFLIRNIKSTLEEHAKSGNVQYEVRKLTFQMVGWNFVDSITLLNADFQHNEYRSKANEAASTELGSKYIDTMKLYAVLEDSIRKMANTRDVNEKFYLASFETTLIFPDSKTDTENGKMILDKDFKRVETRIKI